MLYRSARYSGTHFGRSGVRVWTNMVLVRPSQIPQDFTCMVIAEDEQFISYPRHFGWAHRG
jgi:hypothetical protein